QLVDFVRRMPDDALLALVRAQLGAAAGLGGAVLPAMALPSASSGRTSTGRAAGAKRGRAAAAPARAGRTAKKGAAKKAAGRRGGARRGRGSAAGRQELLGVVEKIVKASSGVSASEVAKAASIPQSRASSALKELKLNRRIFQGGDRR